MSFRACGEVCDRACGEVCDDLCMRSVATRESQRQALREILPLFILLSPSVTALAYIILQLAWKSADVSLGQCFSRITIFIVGLLVPCPLLFTFAFLVEQSLRSYEARRDHYLQHMKPLLSSHTPTDLQCSLVRGYLRHVALTTHMWVKMRWTENCYVLYSRTTMNSKLTNSKTEWLTCCYWPQESNNNTLHIPVHSL